MLTWRPQSREVPDDCGQSVTLCAGARSLEPVSDGYTDAQSKEPVPV